ncbi:hypothetical protein E5A73_05820 [Sphingomonas gei]|uniref:Lipoprotein n=1 Tax=Sphingomonas gei TaxID=1395960 RepID=A0A4S1XG96_9SPHN|nr:hypothetical protein [Sphingomonas gei]TGX54957.1 hypothetical protein E5A73_05820 [Sphingomonas gei]
MRLLSVFASLSIATLVAGCVAPSQPPPRPAPPVAVPAPAPTPAPAPPPRSADWRDWPPTPGNWSWRPEGQGSVATFGLPGQAPELTLRCDRSRSRILLSRRGQLSAPTLIVRTTSQARTLAVTAATTGASAELGVRDALVDAMGYSRGRFVIEGGGMPILVAPAWAEILRVAEDCRG